MRLLNAAKKFKIVPVGFIAGQLQSERALGEQPRPVLLPSGFVTHVDDRHRGLDRSGAALGRPLSRT